MQIELSDPSGDQEFRGGYGVVYKSVNQGLEVAVKALQNHRPGDPQKIARVSNL